MSFSYGNHSPWDSDAYYANFINSFGEIELEYINYDGDHYYGRNLYLESLRIMGQLVITHAE